VFLLPLVLALWRWDRYGDALETSVARWSGPVFLGLACTVKQTPWFVAAFLLVGVAAAAAERGDRWPVVAARYVGVAVATFLVVNVPFIVLDPVAWLRSVLLPLVDATVPDGQGVVALAVRAGLGGGRLDLLGLVGLAGIVVSLLGLLLWWRQLKRVWPVFVPIVLMLPTRSLSTYLVMALPAVLVGCVTAAPARRGVLTPSVRRPLVAAAGLGGAMAVGGVVATLSWPAPLQVSVLDTRTTGAWQTVSAVDVMVTNTGSTPLEPAITLDGEGHYGSIWREAGVAPEGPSLASPLTPGESRTVRLLAPNTQSMPMVSSRFVAIAFLDDPAAVAVSQTHSLQDVSVSLSPQSVPAEIASGTALEVSAQLRDRWGRPSHRAGVQVALGQVTYGQESLLPGTAVINAAPRGRSPVVAVTDAEGIARYRVSGGDPTLGPVYLQAWPVPPEGHPRAGFSNTVSVRFAEGE
jgi:hypothetical protein